MSWSAKNSNLIKLELVKRVRWLYTRLGKWCRHWVFFWLLRDYL